MKKLTTIQKNIGTRKWFAVAAITIAVIAFSLDLTVLNLALPTLSTALHATTNQLEWIVDAYSLVLAVALLPSGLLGDRFGRKKFLLIALAIFGIASLACAYATTASALIVARVALGFGGAFILPLALSVLPVMFTDKDRSKAMAIVMGGVFLAYPLGPILGGWLLTHYWWGSVFLINVPVIAIAMLAIAWLLPESRSEKRPKIDLGGIILSSLGLMGVTYGAIQAEANGWGNANIIASLTAGLLILLSFIFWERRLTRAGRQPLIDLGLFESKGFTWGTLLATGVSFAMFGLLFTVPQYFQSVQGHDALGSGYRLLPMIGGLIIGSGVASKFAKVAGAKIAVGTGFAIMALGLLLGVHTSLTTSDSYTITWIATVGLGLGFSMPTALDAAIGALNAERSGVGSALVSAVRQVGSVLGVAILGTIIGATYRNHLNVHTLPPAVQTHVSNNVASGVATAQKLHSSMLLTSVRSAFLDGMHSLLIVCAGIALVSVILTLVFLPNNRTKDRKPTIA